MNYFANDRTMFRRFGSLILAVFLLAVLCAPVFASDEAADETSDIVWSRGLSDGTVLEELDADGNYTFHVPEGCTLQSLFGYFRSVYGLDEDNFAVSFFCPETEEYYGYNDLSFMHAASTYKLPLNMMYYDMVYFGKLDPDTIVGGFTLDEAHYLSIVQSDNDVSEAMIYYLGTFREYKELMNTYYGQLSEEDLDDSYWSENYYCTRFMLNTLYVLYSHMDHYSELIEYMKQGFPDDDLGMYAGDVPVAHKVGDYGSHYNDVAITFTELPYLIAVYTDGVDSAGEMMGRLNAALIAYQEQKRIELEQAEAEAAAAAEAEAKAKAEQEKQALAEEESDPDPEQTKASAEQELEADSEEEQEQSQDSQLANGVSGLLLRVLKIVLIAIVVVTALLVTMIVLAKKGKL